MSLVLENDHVIVKEDGYVLSVLLNRPKVRHAVSLKMAQSLSAIFDDVAARKDIRVVVLSSTDQYFCSGADLNEGYCGYEDTEQQILKMYLPVLKKMEQLPQTIIAAVPGMTAGIGCALVLNSDLIVMHPSASLYFAFSKIALIADGGIHWLLQRQLGYHKTFELLVSGGRLTAQECLESGLINRVVAEEESCLEAGVAWAQEIAQVAPISAREAKKCLRQISTMSFEQAMVTEAAAQNICAKSQDAKEGIMAFLEKRPANFKGE